MSGSEWIDGDEELPPPYIKVLIFDVIHGEIEAFWSTTPSLWHTERFGIIFRPVKWKYIDRKKRLKEDLLEELIKVKFL